MCTVCANMPCGRFHSLPRHRKQFPPDRRHALTYAPAPSDREAEKRRIGGEIGPEMFYLHRICLSKFTPDAITNVKYYSQSNSAAFAAEAINRESAVRHVCVMYINIYTVAELFVLSAFIMPSEGHFGILYDMHPPPPFGLTPLPPTLIFSVFFPFIATLHSCPDCVSVQWKWSFTFGGI